MKKILVLAAGLLIAVSAAARDNACSTIKSEKARLACYDKNSKAEDTAATDRVDTPKGKSRQFKSHAWVVDASLDPMTDKKQCVALYKNNWTIQGNKDNFFISLKGRGGVESYTLRFDENPADPMQSASEVEKSMSAMVLGQEFDRIYGSKRLRAQIYTLLNGVRYEDIDLAGFKEAVDYMRAHCEK